MRAAARRRSPLSAGRRAEEWLPFVASGPAAGLRSFDPLGASPLTMTTASREVIDRLRALQDLDLRIASLDRDIVGGPKAVEGFERAVVAVDAKIAAQEERIKVLKAQVKLRENEAKTAEAKVERLQDQTTQVKTNKEFAILRTEISSAKADVHKVEEEILKIMEAVEAEEKALAGLREEKAREQRKLDAEKAKVGAAIDGIRSRREDLGKERPALLAGVSAEALAIYERVRTVRGNAVAPIEADYCSGCMERLTRNDVYAVHNASRLVQCKSCNRILYSES
jgi:predicted  nucleic acid-binding Zn-ribbon protein